MYVFSSLIGESVPDVHLGRILAGQYAIYDRIGRGGMGAVYKGLHLGLRRQVAIKTILPDPNPGRLAEHRLRFEREARLLSEMRHQGIVAVYDYGEESGSLYMVLEFLDGESLYDLLRRQGGLALNRAIPIVRALLEALEEPHARGLIHRDIKPSNIMLENRGGRERVVLIDFGIAKVTEEEEGTPRTRTGVFVGTPKYMAPEQLGTGEMGPWTDYYALGVLLYRMLTGSTPFRGSRGEVVASQLRDPPPPLPAELGIAPFDAVVARAMEKKPEDRYPNTDAFLEHLSNAWVECAGETDERNNTAPMTVITPETIVPESYRMTTVKRTSDISGDSASRTDIQRAATVSGPISEVSETTRTAMSGAIERSGKSRRARRGLEWILAAAAIGLALYVGGLWLRPSNPVQSGGDGGRAARQILPQPLPDPSTEPIPGTNTIETPASRGDGVPVDGESATAVRTTKLGLGGDAEGEKKASSAAVKGAGKEDQATSNAGKSQKATPKKAKAPVKKSTRRSKRRGRRSVKRKSRPATPAVPTATRLKGEIRDALKACRCERANTQLKALERLDPSAARSLRSQYGVSCQVIGVGCMK